MLLCLLFQLIMINKIITVKYLKLPFERNLTSSLTPDNLMQNLFNNDIYTKIKIGSEKEEIPISFKMNSFPFYIISTDAKLSKNKMYHYEKSKTFIKFTNDTKTSYKGEQDFDNANTASDILNLPQKNFENLEQFKFLHATKMNEKFLINEAGSIGLFIDASETSFNDIDFIYQLKQRKLIDGYNFYFKYNKKKDNGEFIIGPKPEEIDKKKYNSTNFKGDYSDIDFYRIVWAMNFDRVKYNNISDYTEKIYFQIEKGVIIAPISMKSILKNKFFNNFSCPENSFQSNELNVEYSFFSCDKKVDIKKFGNITFYQKNMNMTFILNYEDLFYYFKGKYYFLVVFPMKTGIDNTWTFGAPFFKKYMFIFNKDTRYIGIYQTFDEPWNISVTIFIIVILILIIGGLLFYIVFYLLKKKRKIRANELEDNYEYISSINK